MALAYSACSALSAIEWVESIKIIILKINKHTAYYCLNPHRHVCNSEKLRRPYNYNISMRIISTNSPLDLWISKYQNCRDYQA